MADDRAALERGESRSVTCFLRGSSEPFPLTMQQGVLEVAAGKLLWRPYWSIRRPAIAIPTPVGNVNVRKPSWSHGEANIKRGKKIIGPLRVPDFQVADASTDKGDISLAIPAVDVPLVLDALATLQLSS